MGNSSSRWQQTALSLLMHINAVISKHSVSEKERETERETESANKMGQAALEAGY